MIGIMGDIHGDFDTLERKVNDAATKGCVAVIQVGDFGYYKKYLPSLMNKKFDIPVYWIDGNHEEHENLVTATDLVEIHDNCFFVPRGTVMEIDGRTFAFMGGAASIDKDLRIEQKWHWSRFELITDNDVERFYKNVEGKTVDVLITHTPPQSVIDKNFDPLNKLYFGVPITWMDPSAGIVENIWQDLGFPEMFCGHMHKNVRDRSCTIIAINEMIYI